jgi:hypothetical protein
MMKGPFASTLGVAGVPNRPLKNFRARSPVYGSTYPMVAHRGGFHRPITHRARTLRSSD